ncbi:MAG: hypothetical protein K6G50_05335 [bacterium]|nr:hypothetical protein [bacterium]
MSKKKKKAAEASQQAPKLTEEQKQEIQRVIERRAQRFLAVAGFAGIGLLMGFLWGANTPIPRIDDSSLLMQAARISIIVAANSAQWMRGLLLGLSIMMAGGTFGYSLFLSPKLMGIGWIGGACGIAAAFALGYPVLGGFGCAAGFFATVLVMFRKMLREAAE